ncbi:hypothetical protein ACPVTF_04130 [Geobacillus icigianus]|uniref:Phage protein n=1 Tax=Geobacillus subterraneus TaxID=129338 RepID=A0A679FL32_9BACL|nr:hypothetical protein [Geobacillus subterraneus]BBW97232.1 hypothetical protein GsuE55_20650 [Geobacillus subterraneus]
MFKNFYADQAAQNLGGYRLNLQFFSGDGGQHEGGQPETDPASAHSDPSAQEPPKEPEKSFTQDDVNNIVAKEVKKAQEKLLKQLGIEDFNSAKEGLQKFREWQESQKTEQQKQAERLQQLEQQFTAVQQEKENLSAQLTAIKAGVIADYVEDVVVLAQRLVNDDTTLEEAITKVLEKYPHFKEAQQQQESPKPQFSTGQHAKSGGSEPLSLREALAQRFAQR